jgi:hypothetical protein
MSTFTNAADLGTRLHLLLLERSLADLEGLTAHARYRADLEGEISATRSAYVGAAVTELASLRAQLSGPLHG